MLGVVLHALVAVAHAAAAAAATVAAVVAAAAAAAAAVAAAAAAALCCLGPRKVRWFCFVLCLFELSLIPEEDGARGGPPWRWGGFSPRWGMGV